MKKSVLALTAAVGVALTAFAAGPAQAMGSGNNYADFQVGVSYTVYQPTYTNGLKQTSFNGNASDADCSAGAMTSDGDTSATGEADGSASSTR